jgi:hypothetical protein
LVCSSGYKSKLAINFVDIAHSNTALNKKINFALFAKKADKKSIIIKIPGGRKI